MRSRLSLILVAILFGAAAAYLPVLAPARAQVVAPELTPNLGWLNTDRPLRFSDELKGHVVVLDFWTYCCINCMHILPDLEYLEHKYKDEPVVVIGVHSAKFDNEAQRRSIRNAVFRYGIHHPVVIDDHMAIWNKYGAGGWPTFVVIGTDGKIAPLPGGITGVRYSVSGEGNRQILDEAIAEALKQGRKNGTIAEHRVKIVPGRNVPSTSGLEFPGKVLADPPNAEAKSSGRLFIADSTHNRVLEATYPDSDGHASLIQAFGSGEEGLADGPAAAARFHDPQGMALDPNHNVLYVADTKNHSIRSVDLGKGVVSTLVGTGEQSYDRSGGGSGIEQGLSSPWALALSRDGSTLYVAMAGTHQLWSVDTRSGAASALAGNGRENITDGPAASAMLAQPSGLALTPGGGALYFVDSESSSVRVLDPKRRMVLTIIGVGLFNFGDVDGRYPKARLQHPLGVTFYPSPDGARLLVADTYNHKIKLIDPSKRSAQTWLGESRDEPVGDGGVRLDEPGGLNLAVDPQTGEPLALFIADTNNNRVLMVDPKTKSWREVMIDGLRSDSAPAAVDADAPSVTVKARPGAQLTLKLTGDVPAGHHPTPQAPMSVRVTTGGRTLVQRTFDSGEFPLSVRVPGEAVQPGAELGVELSYATCDDTMGVCVPGFAAWRVTIRQGDSDEAALTQTRKAD